MSLSVHDRELIALGISVAAGCRPCTAHHRAEAHQAGAEAAEIERAVLTAIGVRDRATQLMESFALQEDDGMGLPTDMVGAGGSERLTTLTALGAAFSLGCTLSLQRHLRQALALGIPKTDLRSVLRLAEFVSDRAAYHVEQVAIENVGGKSKPREGSPEECFC